MPQYGGRTRAENAECIWHSYASVFPVYHVYFFMWRLLPYRWAVRSLDAFGWACVRSLRSIVLRNYSYFSIDNISNNSVQHFMNHCSQETYGSNTCWCEMCVCEICLAAPMRKPTALSWGHVVCRATDGEECDILRTNRLFHKTKIWGKLAFVFSTCLWNNPAVIVFLSIWITVVWEDLFAFSKNVHFSVKGIHCPTLLKQFNAWFMNAHNHFDFPK